MRAIVLVVIVLAVLAGTAAVAGRRSGHDGEGHDGEGRDAAARAAGLRDLLTDVLVFVLLFVLVVVATVGTAGLLGQLLERLIGDGALNGAFDDAATVDGRMEAARNGAFVMVGLPLAVAVGLRARRTVRSAPPDRPVMAWAVFASALSLTSLLFAATGAHAGLLWAFGRVWEQPRAVAQFVVWATLWFAVRRLDTRLTPVGHRWPHLLVGSAVGLATTCVGVVGVIGNALDIVFGTRLDFVAEPRQQILNGVATLLVGAAVWTACWWTGAVRATGDLLRTGYALLAGCVAGVVTTVISTTWVLGDVLVWFVGTPTGGATAHFDQTPHAAAAVAVGVLLWTYHRALLGRVGATAAAGRTAAHRLADYAPAAIGVVAGSVGVTLLVAAGVDAATGPAGTSTPRPENLALLAVALLATGAGVWWVGWRPVRRAVRADAGPERVSVPRRLYLLGLTGAGLLAGIGALVGLVYVVLEDTIAGTVALGTVRDLRFVLGVLVAAAVVVGTHVRTARAEQALRVPVRQAPRFVVLVGPPDAAVGHEVARATGARVLSWPRTDGVRTDWPVEQVARLVAGTPGPEVVVLAGPDGLLAVPVDRSRGTVAAVTVAATHPSRDI